MKIFLILLPLLFSCGKKGLIESKIESVGISYISESNDLKVLNYYNGTNTELIELEHYILNKNNYDLVSTYDNDSYTFYISFWKTKKKIYS